MSATATLQKDPSKDGGNAETGNSNRNLRTRLRSPTKKETPTEIPIVNVKKESFKWSTPADEFADDVASDDDDMGNDAGSEDDDRGSPIAAEIDGRQYEAHRTADGGIVIHLGGVEEEDAVREMRTAGILGEETNEEIKKFIENYDKTNRKNRKKKGGPKQKFQCPKCDKVWNWPWELRRHVLTHYKEKEREQTSTFKCEECGRGFQWKRDLAQHMRLHTGEKLLVCSVCQKKFTTRQALLHHVVVHTGEKPFICALCGNRFTQPANLRTHMKKKHDDSVIKSNRCPHCHEPFQSIIAVHQHILEDHQNIVAAERELQMLEKMKKEQEKADRERIREENRRKRMEKRREKIDYNDFRSQGLHEWEINYEFHIGEGLVKGVDWDRTPSNGELSCEICDRTFGWRYEVMFHNLCHKMDEHGNAKNRVCPECDTAFKVPIGLKHHLLLHTGELPFLCLHCWRSFSSHIDLKLHIRKEHLAHLDVSKVDGGSSANSPKKSTVKVKAESSKKSPGTEEKRARTASNEQQANVQQVAFVQSEGSGSSAVAENVQVMVANQANGNAENQTIVLNSDGTIVQTGDQDMIVVIQSEDFDQSQGLIVVDPNQLQHVVNADGTPVTLVEASDTMILGSSGDAKVIVRQTGDKTTPATSTTSATASTSTVVVSSTQQQNSEEHGGMIVSDPVSQSAPSGHEGEEGIAEGGEEVPQTNVQTAEETKTGILKQDTKSLKAESASKANA